MKTSGHLVNNGGIRGHSAGEFYPFRVIAKGKQNAIRWHVVKPNGTLCEVSYTVVGDAFITARLLHSVWSA